MTMSLDADDTRADTRGGAAPAAPVGWTWWSLRVLLTATATDAFLQPVFAGRFLSGDFAMLATHRANATYVGVLAVGQTLVAILAWRASRLPGAVASAVVALGTATALQIYLGFNRVLGIHVPLGVAVIGVAGWVAGWMWTHRPAGQPTGKPATLIREQR